MSGLRGKGLLGRLQGFVFPGCPGPYEEYPVLQGSTFTGSTPPGPHRVIYQTFIGEVCGQCAYFSVGSLHLSASE